MKKHKLHQRFTFIFTILIFASCSQKNFPANNAAEAESFHTLIPEKYIPEAVLVISDEKVKINKEGEMYYDDEYGYRYWKMADGKYYLDNKYINGARPDKKTSQKNNKKQTEKKQQIKHTAEIIAITGT